MVSQLLMLAQLLLAAVLSFLVGYERAYQAKSAGIGTYMLVGVGSALFTIVGQYGFVVLGGSGASGVDGSRVAAQIVSGIGFLGAGLIFVRKDSVRGLTTAAGIWFVAGIGMACATKMTVLAVGATALYLLMVWFARLATKHMPHAPTSRRDLTVTYADGQGVLRDLLQTISDNGMMVRELKVLDSATDVSGERLQSVLLRIFGDTSAVAGVDALARELPGVRHVSPDTWNEELGD